MRIEILTFEGCPHAGAARELVHKAVRLEAADAAIHVVAVETPEAAHRLRFLGSPSVRVDGADVEPSANDRTAYGLMCRTYNHGSQTVAAPSIEMIRGAIRCAAALEQSRWTASK
jgi:hypothetical protein